MEQAGWITAVRGERTARSGDAAGGDRIGSGYTCEAVVAEGLEEIAREELWRRLGDRARFQRSRGADIPGTVPFSFAGDLGQLVELRTVLAVYLVGHFDVPRPRALLGDAHLRHVSDGVKVVRALWPAGTFTTLSLRAAGAESAVLVRLRDELAAQTGLVPGPRDGDLQVRLRRPEGGAAGWDVLLRLSPRPLATRDWRVCNLPGALNASVARAMVIMTHPRPGEVFLNVGCGSGTLLIERLECGPVARAIGCDIDPAALRCAEANVAASGHTAAIEVQPWDARALPMAAGSVDSLCADLPFGHLSGSHDDNKALYPALLREAARVARAGALFVAITHETRLMTGLLAGAQDAWEPVRRLRVALGEVRPTIFVVRRR